MKFEFRKNCIELLLMKAKLEYISITITW